VRFLDLNIGDRFPSQRRWPSDEGGIVFVKVPVAVEDECWVNAMPEGRDLGDRRQFSDDDEVERVTTAR
jgi:hypothetical protein